MDRYTNKYKKILKHANHEKEKSVKPSYPIPKANYMIKHVKQEIV